RTVTSEALTLAARSRKDMAPLARTSSRMCSRRSAAKAGLISSAMYNPLSVSVPSDTGTPRVVRALVPEPIYSPDLSFSATLWVSMASGSTTSGSSVTRSTKAPSTRPTWAPAPDDDCRDVAAFPGDGLTCHEADSRFLLYPHHPLRGLWPHNGCMTPVSSPLVSTIWWAHTFDASERLTRLLDENELARNARFLSQADRDRHLLGRAMAKLALADLVGCAPDKITFDLHCRSCE